MEKNKKTADIKKYKKEYKEKNRAILKEKHICGLCGGRYTTENRKYHELTLRHRLCLPENKELKDEYDRINKEKTENINRIRQLAKEEKESKRKVKIDDINKTIECNICGCKYKKKNEYVHQNTKKHKNIMNMVNMYQFMKTKYGDKVEVTDFIDYIKENNKQKEPEIEYKEETELDKLKKMVNNFYEAE